jgi:hypothetical protein
MQGPSMMFMMLGTTFEASSKMPQSLPCRSAFASFFLSLQTNIFHTDFEHDKYLPGLCRK